MTTKMYRIRPVDGLGRALVVLLAIDGAVSLINGVGTFTFWRTQRFVIDVSTRPGRVEDPFAMWPQPGGAGIGLAASLVGLTIVVVWLIWQHHATANLWARGFPGLSTTPGWAVGWWFVPFANLVLPFLSMRELDRRSTGDGREGRSGAELGWWWAAFLLATLGPSVGFLTVFASRMSGWVDAVDRGAGTIDLTPVMHELAVWTLAGAVGRTVAAVLAMVVVRRITRAQEDVVRQPLPQRPDTWGAGSLPPG